MASRPKAVPAPETARVPPSNLDAEECVLGAMMLSEYAVDAAAERVEPGDFYRASHGRIFSACVALHDEGEPVDAVTVAARMERDGTLEDVGGRARIHEIATLVPAAANVRHYAGIVAEQAVRRRILTLARKAEEVGYDGPQDAAGLIEEVQGLAFDLTRGRATDFVPAREAVSEALDRLTRLFEGGQEIVGLPTGYRDLDRILSGLQPGNLIVVAARPSMGKSGLVCGFAQHAILRLSLPVAFFTLEMTRTEIVNRMIGAEALIESTKLVNGRMDSDEWKRAMRTGAALAESRLFLDPNRLTTPTEIRAKCRRLKILHPDLALIVVDYLQLMARSTRSNERVGEVAQISRTLKVIAGELDVPVVAVSQLSRALETRHDRRPILSDLRDSGAIEQDADVVVFVYRDEVYNPEDPDVHGIAELNVAKQRNGPTDTVKVAFVKRYARFSELPRPGAGPRGEP